MQPVVQPVVQPSVQLISNDTLSTQTPSTSTLVIVPSSATTETPSSTPVVNNNTTSSETPQLMEEEEEDEGFDFWEFHGIILTILWSILNFFGYVYARFLRHHPIWIWIHFTCSGLTSLISVAVMAASIAKGK